MKLTVLDRIWIRLSQPPNFLRIPFPQILYCWLKAKKSDIISIFWGFSQQKESKGKEYARH